MSKASVRLVPSASPHSGWKAPYIVGNLRSWWIVCDMRWANSDISRVVRVLTTSTDRVGNTSSRAFWASLWHLNKTTNKSRPESVITAITLHTPWRFGDLLSTSASGGTDISQSSLAEGDGWSSGGGMSLVRRGDGHILTSDGRGESWERSNQMRSPWFFKWCVDSYPNLLALTRIRLHWSAHTPLASGSQYRMWSWSGTSCCLLWHSDGNPSCRVQRQLQPLASTSVNSIVK